jgi:hypothetical protein
MSQYLPEKQSVALPVLEPDTSRTWAGGAVRGPGRATETEVSNQNERETESTDNSVGTLTRL